MSAAKRGRKSDEYLMWLCWHLCCEVDETTEFPPQHHGENGKFTVVGNLLNISSKTVAYHCTNARKLRDTPAGRLFYIQWKDLREKRWWLYHVVCIEKKELKLLEYVGETERDNLILSRIDADTVHLTRRAANSLVGEARKRLETPAGKHDYKAWLTLYEQRDPLARGKPFSYDLLPADHPSTIESQERREAKGLRAGLTKAGRPSRIN